MRRTVRIRRGAPETSTPWEGLLASDRPFRLGWLAAPLSGRDRRHLGLIHLLDKRDGDFTDEDEAILTQLAQMTSIAIENTLNAEAREANRIKDEFLTTLSHELRTPLSAILGWTRTLRTGAADAVKVEHGLEVIERNVRAQTKLIDDLLDVSRIITGKLRLTVRPAALAPIIDAALDAMRPAAEAKDIQIAVERRLSPGEDMVVGDPDRLQQVVWNLVSNAIKFTPPGGRVTVELSRADADFQIRVSDTGRGISPEFLPRVFERFHQGDSSTTRAHGGLGIGLAIARHLVELHGGTISAQSPGENAGSFFTVLLPRVALGIHTPEALPREEEPAVPGARASVGNIEGVSVLLVEDEPDGRELLVEALRTAGGRVAAAESARAALALFADCPPDVLVSDIGMPEEDGYALIRAIRALPADRGGAVPAIAVTAYAREEDRLRALAAGFQAHIAKPVDPGELVAAVARVAWAGNSREP
ncbi:MAG TPA: ATP-binding protein, partial [Thermoanaerobaculia bacterium]|nr:ATP-binding protein [Thermoanaerobaculia bacterium]